MRGPSARTVGFNDLRRSLDRLECLPMRPTSARLVLESLLDLEDQEPSLFAPPASLPSITELDPSWALARSRSDSKGVEPLQVLAEHRWWTADATGESLTKLWRHSVAVAFAAQRLARDGDDADPDAIARGGLLHGLGLWAVTSIAPGWLTTWLDLPDRASRLAFERQSIGVEASSLGRSLATRWGCEPLVVDATWLHADLGLGLQACASDPGRLAYIQQGLALAERTPWALGIGAGREFTSTDAQVRILMAEVQARCGVAFVEPDATPREERLTRDNARLRLSQLQLTVERDSLERFSQAVADSSPFDSPQVWSDRASLAWCGEPGVSAARVVWGGSDRPDGEEVRPPSIILPLGEVNRPQAEVHLWQRDGWPGRKLDASSSFAAWNAWTRSVAERVRLQTVLDDVVAAHRARVLLEEPTLQRAKLEALAEFAAGAGHELNNPLAVIVGRGQLLLAREVEPDAQKSLRAIITQAQRAHRILRDLMYVARPPEPRPRACQPSEIVRASLRDIQLEAEARGVRVEFEPGDSTLRVWADPDPLRQVADVLVRNALEATPSGGSIRVATGGDPRKLRWTIHDTGRGIGPLEGAHLFDPFYCGRQAGRGLGLGLPRVARIIAQAGGDLKWQSNVGVGSTFLVELPVAEIPLATDEERPGDPKGGRALPVR